MSIKECDVLFDVACDYIAELQFMKDAHIKWLEEVNTRHAELLADKKAEKHDLLPKTPSLKSRLRKRTRKISQDDDDDHSMPSNKSFQLGFDLKKVSICLERIDESPAVQEVLEKPVKLKAPVKPPRSLKFVKQNDVDQQMTSGPAITAVDDKTSPSTSPMFTSSASLVLSQEKRRNSHHPPVTCSPMNLNLTAYNKRGTISIPDLSIAHMSISRRRSSVVRERLRASARLSKRLTQAKRKSVLDLPQIVNLHESRKSLSLTEDEGTNIVDEQEVPEVEIGVVKCVEEQIPNQAKPVKKKLPESGIIGELENANPTCKFNTTYSPNDGLGNEHLNHQLPNLEVTEHDSEDLKAKRSSSREHNGSTDIDSVISKTPSPRCPANKIVRPKVMATRSTFIMIGSLSANRFTTPVDSTGHKASVIVASAGRNRSGKSSLNMVSSRLSPKVMTPQEKQERCLEKIQQREMKSQEVLRKRNEYMKKKIEDQRRNREAKLRKVIQAKEHNKKQQEAKLLKLLEEEDKRYNMIMLKKEYEEQEKRRLTERRQAELQKQMEIEKERQREIARQKEERKKLKKQKKIAREKAQLEQVMQQERLAQEQLQQEEETQKLLAEKQPKQNVEEKTVKVAANQQTGHAALNGTFTLETSVNNNYEITPQRIYPMPNLNPNNYDIEDLKEGDSTDDDEQPKKKIPAWAEGRVFKIAILEQVRKPMNIAEIFPPNDLMLIPDLTKIFSSKKKRFLQRTSSAVWTSPLFKAASKQISSP